MSEQSGDRTDHAYVKCLGCGWVREEDEFDSREDAEDAAVHDAVGWKEVDEVAGLEVDDDE